MDKSLTEVANKMHDEVTASFEDEKVILEEFDDLKVAATSFLAAANELKPHHFGVYLKRYLFERYKDELPPADTFDKVPDSEYIALLRKAFHDTDTDSFGKSKAEVQMKNWLTQRAIDRQSAFALAYALDIPADYFEQEFLKKALLQAGYDFKDPRETILWFCLNQNGCDAQKCEKNDRSRSRYRHAQSLLEQYENRAKTEQKDGSQAALPPANQTSFFKQDFKECSTDGELLDKIFESKLILTRIRQTAFERFVILLNNLKAILIQTDILRQLRADQDDIQEQIAKAESNSDNERYYRNKQNLIDETIQNLKIKTVYCEKLQNSFLYDRDKLSEKRRRFLLRELTDFYSPPVFSKEVSTTKTDETDKNAKDYIERLRQLIENLQGKDVFTDFYPENIHEGCDKQDARDLLQKLIEKININKVLSLNESIELLREIRAILNFFCQSGVKNTFVIQKLYASAFENYNLIKLKEAFKFIYSEPDGRLSQARLENILSMKSAVTRSDLLNILFLNFSCRSDFESKLQRYKVFLAEVDADLTSCGFEALRKTNPYDFVLAACMRTDEPLTTFQICHSFSVEIAEKDIEYSISEDNMNPDWG